ncbi:MAG: SDR family oxidoreductase [Cyclobacteriaceae bacterium]|nr:SDR family oxidoreductase [Cyclobacteriaceae bacterium]
MSFFKDKVAIITGSGMGIGKATALELAAQGAKVVLNGRNAERLQKAFEELKAKGHDVIAIPCDITSAADCENLIRQTIETYGKLDILITNASISMREKFENLQPEVFSQIIHSNINGSAFPAWYALPHLKKTKGSITFISSAAGMIGMPTGSAYSAGKMALTALAQSMKIELDGSGVHVGIVHVGFTQNEDAKRVLNAKGELVPVAPRPPYLQQTREQVAKAILRSIKSRQFKTVLTIVGKLNAFMVRFFPGLVIRIIMYSQKRMKDMYE